jgi:hypothetical protein
MTPPDGLTATLADYWPIHLFVLAAGAILLSCAVWDLWHHDRRGARVATLVLGYVGCAAVTIHTGPGGPWWLSAAGTTAAIGVAVAAMWQPGQR